ncbi:major pollen allergen Lol p 11-like [Tasmannia lanceolata]|uniref:major pollen allergen Lol p 11-like n=1 Tax=Tasmannia lanceolata TaxID=3420 RepID=UPI0040630793
MAKLQSLCVIAALCFLSALGIACANTNFLIEGRVYCDTCRAGFETDATYYIPGAKVKLECVQRNDHKITFIREAVTDNTGSYKIEAPDDHQEEICEVVLVSSPVAGCNELKVGRDRARILLTENSGIVSNNRYANALGFYKTTTLQICPTLLAKYYTNEDN